jgi:hypothetical protein
MVVPNTGIPPGASCMKVWELRKKICAPQSRTTFVSFLFSQYKRICEFGRNTHVLYPKLFPLSIQLNSDIHVTFTKYLQPQSIELYKVLAYILKKKWSLLERREYNLVLVLKKLCEKIALINFNLLNYADKNLIDRLRSLETYFIALYAGENYLHILMNAVKRILESEACFKLQIPELLGAMNRLLLPDADTPSLYNVLLGLNMLKYRRFLTIQDLVNSGCSDFMGKQFFEYEEDVQQEIQLFVQESEKNLKFLSAKKREIEMIKQFLPCTAEGGIDFGMLRHFYASSQSEGEYQFERDQDDTVQLSLRILKIYRKSFFNLLCGKVRLFSAGRCRVFPDTCFKSEFVQLDDLIERLGKLSHDYTNAISFKQYLQMKQTKKFTSKMESDTIMLVSDALHLVYNLGKRAAFELYDKNEKAETDAGDGTDEAAADREPVPEHVLRAKILTQDARLGGKRVSEALSFLVSISFLICHYYHDRYTYALLSREAMIHREIKQKMEMLSRIATPELYKRLVYTYGQ